MFRRPIVVAAALSTSIYSKTAHKTSHCNNVPFDAKGMPTIMKPSFYPPNQPTPTPLYLTGVGMRRKNLYVVEVDVYMCALNFSKPALMSAKNWKNQPNGESLTDALLKGEGELGVACTLKFQREVGNAAFVDALVAAFAGCKDVDAVAKFKKTLGEAVGTSAKKDDTIVFYWLGSTNLAFSKNGSTPVICDLQSKEICSRLLDLYVDPSKTVSKELTTCVDTHLKDFEA